MRHDLSGWAAAALLAIPAGAQQPTPPASSGEQELRLGDLGESREGTSPLLDNLRWSIDVAARVSFDDRRDAWDNAYFLGLDVHKVFSGQNGDWGTLVLQPYATRLDSPMHPPFFEDDHDWELVYRIFNFNYTGLANGAFNLRAGHMEIPFGLEQVVNTNGTLRDYLHGRNLGVKADWGVSVNGELPAWDYEVALTRGTGNEWSDRGNPYVAAGRIATSRDEPLSAGLSAFHGEVQRTALPGNTLRRTRFGVDLTWDAGPFVVLAEASAGEDAGMEVANGLVELDWTNPSESLLVYDQLIAFNADMPTGWENATANVLGARWTFCEETSVSFEWRQDLTVFPGSTENTVLRFQVRHRF